MKLIMLTCYASFYVHFPLIESDIFGVIGKLVYQRIKVIFVVFNWMIGQIEFVKIDPLGDPAKFTVEC